MDSAQYRKLLETCDDYLYIAQSILRSMAPEELQAKFGIEKPGLAAHSPMPLHWRKNPGYDSQGNLVCAGCGTPMAVAQAKDGHNHASCTKAGCSLYGKDYIEGSESRNPHRHSPAQYNPESGRYVCGCGVEL